MFCLPYNIIDSGGPFYWQRCISNRNVRFWLLADIQPHPELCPLYPRKRTFFSTGIYVCFDPKRTFIGLCELAGCTEKKGGHTLRISPGFTQNPR